MEGSDIISELPSADSEHWLNGFLQLKSEEARKRVLEERTLWNFTDDENSHEECDVTGIFNFKDEESNRQSDEENLSFENLDLRVPTEKKRATVNGGLSIGRDEQRFASDDTRSQDDDRAATLQSRQCLNSSSLAQASTTSNDEISTNDGELRVEHDDVEQRLAEHVPNGNDESGLDFEIELVEVASMGIVHSKQKLLKAIDEFNKKVVEMERVNFMQTMLQIEETVNEVLEEVERLDSSFKLQRMSPDSYYELKSRNEIDILVVLDNVTPEEFVIEDMKTPTGYARIRLTSSTLTSSSSMASSSHMTSALNMASPDGEMLHWCTDTQSGEIYFSPKKLCKRFAALVSRAAGKTLRQGTSAQRKRVSFSDREATVPFVVNLIPTVACPQTWPLCAYWLRNCSKKWPPPRVKDDVIHGGMHLVAMVTNKESDPLWHISFCSARRRLLQSDCEGKKKCLRLLKVLLDKDLSWPKGIMPLYLENIVLWASRKHWQEEKWAECMLADRFLEMLVALLKCLENNDCYHFFVPTVDLFRDLKPDVAKVLAAKVRDILDNPFKYLKT
ncbi:protein mab-21-like 2 [Oculina patagonica]